MKEKVKQFFVEKKELLIFIGVLAFVFTAVMIISSIALKEDDSPIDVDKPEPALTDDGTVDQPTSPEELKSHLVILQVKELISLEFIMI